MGMEKRGLLKNIINILLDILMVLFGIILLISIYNNVQIHILGNKYSSFFGYSNFEVQTGSMEPTISAGDWIIVKQTKNVKLDDIVTYEKEGEFITHRVLEAYRGTYITKGDANNSKDEAISQDQIVGTVVKILPGFGIIRRTLLNPVVLIAMIITLYLLGYALKGNKKTDKESLLQKFFDTKVVPKKKIKIKVKKEKPVQAVIETKEEKVEEVVEEEPIAEKIEEVQEEVSEEVVEDIPEEVVEEEEINEDLVSTLEEPADEEDLTKTMYFRMVNVSKEDLNNNSIEVPQQEVEETIEETKEKEDDEKPENTEVADKIKLIQNRRKKYKNIIDKIIYIKNEELNEILEILNNNDRYKVNESSIKDEIQKDYVDGKYYNYCGNVNVEYNGKNMLTRIDAELKAKGDALIKKYKGNDSNYAEKVKKFVNLYLLINSLEEYFRKDEDTKAKRDVYSNKITKHIKDISDFELKNMITKILKVQRVYASVVNHLINEQASTTFQLEFSKITGHKNLIGADLNHNIQFSKVYSDYIVKKTYNDGTVAEDKSIILVNLLLVEVLKDMYAGDFFKNYIIPIAGSIYSKSTKMERTFNILGDEYAKKNIIILLEYTDLVGNKKVLKALKKDGFRFAVVFRYGDEIKDKDQKMLSICDYAFVDKKETEIIKALPEELKGNVINDDILKKLNVDGGK